MKSSLLVLSLLFTLMQISTGQVIQTEYFWDTDPGQGNGTAITALDGNLDEVVEGLFSNNTNLPIASPSLHSFNIRVQDINGNWGPIFSSIINMENIVNGTNKHITQAEYFWDTDPGQGNGTIILALDGNLDEVVEELFSNNTNLPIASPPSLHSFNIRVQDINGNWGPIFSSIINMDNIVNGTNKHITQAEYFWDTDPGQGNGTIILALDGNFNEATETAFNNSLSLIANGLHKFCIRVKDEKNNWGAVFCSVISVQSIVSVNENESSPLLTSVFPNPFNELITIQLNTLERDLIYEFYDVTGKLLKSKNINSKHITINTSEISKGIYFVKINQQVFRIVKN